MTPREVLATVDTDLHEPTQEQEARALQLCLRHLIRDAEDLGFADVQQHLQRAVAAITCALETGAVRS